MAQLELELMREFWTIAIIGFGRFGQIGYACAGGTLVIYCNLLSVKRVEDLTKFIESRTRNERDSMTPLPVGIHVEIAVAVNKLAANIHGICQKSGVIVHLYLVYTIFVGFQLFAGFLGSLRLQVSERSEASEP